MKTQWTIELKTREGQSCGTVEGSSIDECVEQAKYEMPWCTEKHLKSLCKKCKSTQKRKNEEYDDD